MAKAPSKRLFGNMQKGFTLIELLIVIAVIVILAAAVFVALNPAKRFADARNSRRQTDVQNVLNAIKTNEVDNGGSYLASITALTAGTEYQIGTAASGCDSGCGAVTTEAACADITGLVTAGYLGSIPMDPSTGTAAETDYYIVRNSAGTVTVGTCDGENGVATVLTR